MLGSKSLKCLLWKHVRLSPDCSAPDLFHSRVCLFSGKKSFVLRIHVSSEKEEQQGERWCSINRGRVATRVSHNITLCWRRTYCYRRLQWFTTEHNTQWRATVQGFNYGHRFRQNIMWLWVVPIRSSGLDFDQKIQHSSVKYSTALSFGFKCWSIGCVG